MSEILFKAKDVNHEWVEGFVGATFTADENRKPILRNFTEIDCIGWTSHTYVYDATVVQYTGTPDKNNQKIFECDIVKAFKNNEEPFVAVVTKRNGCFWFGNWNWCEFLDKFRNYEVIGNVFDNPELVKGGEQGG